MVHRHASDDHEPLVSVVTPFYNTASYLSECIEAVLAQTWQNFEYILLNNCSADGSGEIAKKYEARDSRIRVIEATEHLPQVPNFNRALREISPDSRYCKIALADDWLLPECLECMVEIAEAHEDVGIISSLRSVGVEVDGAGLAVGRSVYPGREVCRLQLLQGRFVLGSPNTVMYRSERSTGTATARSARR